jgi:ESCRT-II complex subunit VPS25
MSTTNPYSASMAVPSSTPTPPPTTSPSKPEFTFPARYHFPPMWTLQPTLSTRSEQMKWWGAFIQSFCSHYRIFRLTLIHALDTPLFHNTRLNKRLSRDEAQTVLDWMASEEGGRRAEWIGKDGERASVWVYWRRPEEWAEGVAKWVCILDAVVGCADES